MTVSDTPRSPKRWLWARTIALTLIAALAVRIVMILLALLFAAKRFSYETPWTFHTLWEIGYLIFAALITVRLGSQVENFMVMIFLGICTSGIVGLFLSDWFMPSPPRYYGVECCGALDSNQDGEPDSWRGGPLPLRGCLYHKKNPPLVGELFEQSHAGVNLSGRGYIFWQTGLACGYNPVAISGFDENERTFAGRLELLFTVGPLAIVESAIRALTFDFPILFLYVLYSRLWCKEDPWFEPVMRRAYGSDR